MSAGSWNSDDSFWIALRSDEFHELPEDMVYYQTNELLLTFCRVPNVSHDLSIIKHFPRLTDLTIEFEGDFDEEGHPIKDYNFSLRGIDNCPRLFHLIINNAQDLKDLNGLEFCPELISLTVYGEGCPLNLEAIYDLRSIDDLTLYTPIDLESIDFTRFPRLEELTLELPDHVRDLKILQGCRLKNLHVLGKIETLKGLCTDKLEELSAVDNKIRTIKTLRYAYKLRTLNLCGNRIRDFSPLDHLRITELYLRSYKR